MNKLKKILIIRTDRIGDLVLTIPLAGIIKKRFPSSEVHFLIADYTLPLLKNHPDIESLIIYTKNSGELLNKIKDRNFDVAILVHPTFELARLIYNSKIPIRISTGYRWYSFLFTDKVYEHRKHGEKHELELNVNLLKPLGINETVTKKSVSFNIQRELKAIQKVDTTLAETSFDNKKQTVIIHPGSRGSAIDLPETKFAELINLLARELSINIILTGSKDETKLCERLSSGNNAINLAGKFNLSELIALIGKADVLIANSTGPIHIAAALGKYCVGFYPPVPALSAKRWSPYTEKATLFIPNVACKNQCTKKECLTLKCMENIDVKEVATTIQNILKK